MSGRRPLAARVGARLRGPGAWRTWAGLALLTALVGYALFRLLWRELPTLDLAGLFARVSAADIAAAVGVYTLDLALAILAWGLIIGAIGGAGGPLDHIRIYLVTAMTRRIPGTFWYLLGRAVLYERLGVPRAATALAGGVEYAVTMVGGLIVALATWPLLISAQTLNPLWLAAPLLVIALLLNPPAVRALMRRLSPGHDASQLRYRQLLLWVALLIMVWVVGGWLLYVLILAVRPLPLSALPAVVGAWATAGVAAMIFFSFIPFGLGATELTIASLLSPLMPVSEALFAALLMRALLTVCELAFGLGGLALGLPGLIRARRGGDPPLGGGSLPDAEKPEGLFEAGPVVPRKEPGFGPK